VRARAADIATAGWILFLDRRSSFLIRPDVDAKGMFMAESKSLGVDALVVHQSGGMEDQASWYLIVTEDKMIPPPAQHFMAKRAGSTVVEVRGQPCDLCIAAKRRCTLIENASKGVNKKSRF